MTQTKYFIKEGEVVDPEAVMDPVDGGVIVRSAHFTRYSVVRAALHALDGVSLNELRQMLKDISALRGTPQETRDWKKPDEWIDALLHGSTAVLAHRIWDESSNVANPRHIAGAYHMARAYNLLELDSDGRLELAERGKRFMAEDFDIIAEIGLAEGLIHLL